MKRVLVIILALLALPVAAKTTSGSWSRSSAGGSVSVGKQLLRGRPLFSPPSLPPSATVTRFSWRITLLSPPPPGLQIKLCRSDKCFLLPSLAGQRTVSTPLSPAGEFRFIYSVNSLGQLRPVLTVVSNQLTVNYR
ncbi:flagellar protein FlhE [Vagococcus sp. WN89Y]|uniref:flagellar protein FlhE n=1 Tax=Vagococcus sp. WN89Y TaxID=3457258 RepID=UPI003FCD787B